MKHLQRKIDIKKKAINDQKRALTANYKIVKNKLSSTSNLSFTTLGAFVVGFLFLPKKKRLLKLLLKTYTVVMTAKQFLEFLPDHHHRQQSKKPTTYRKDRH